MIHTHRNLWLSSVLLVFAAFAISALLWSRLPDPVPTHWGIDGRVNGWMPKFPGAVISPLVMIGMLALFAALPAISPSGFRMERFGTVYSWMVLGLTALLLVIHVLVLSAALGHDAAVSHGMPLVLAVAMILLGNWMPKVRRNFFVGIRTPWTIANEEVWAKTHRFAGKTMVVGGVAAVIAAVSPAARWLPIALVLAAVLLPAVYSYVAWKSMQPARH